MVRIAWRMTPQSRIRARLRYTTGAQTARLHNVLLDESPSSMRHAQGDHYLFPEPRGGFLPTEFEALGPSACTE
jgi:hypothetical protein